MTRIEFYEMTLPDTLIADPEATVTCVGRTVPPVPALNITVYVGVGVGPGGVGPGVAVQWANRV